MSLEGKRATLVIAHARYRDEELDEPRRVLERAGVAVEVVSSSLGLASGMQGGSCSPDRLYSAVGLADFDALVFVGGDGAVEYFDDVTALRLVREGVQQGKVVAGICFAASILANAGVLEGVEATGYPAREVHLRARGALYTGDPVTVSGRIVTGRGPDDARAFADALVSALA